MEVIGFIFAAIVCIVTLTLGSYVVAFYHSFDSNRPKLDKYSLVTVSIFLLLFYVLMRLVVSRW